MFLPIMFFSSSSPCWFFIRGGDWGKLPRKVSYKCTFGVSNQGQMLDVWGDSCQADVNPEVLVTVMSPSQLPEISNKKDINR